MSAPDSGPSVTKGDSASSPNHRSTHLSERTREVIAARGVSYIDSTGNIRLRSDKPALYILTNGADKDPWPDDQPLKSLRGRGAGRALRAVVDFRPPYGVRELAGRANVSPPRLQG